MTAAQSAQTANVPYSTWSRWLERWHALRVAGIRRVAARARGGHRYVVDPAVIERWLSGELATPYRYA